MRRGVRSSIADGAGAVVLPGACIGRHVVVGAGAKILGNIEVGEYSRVGAGSVVLKSVPPGCTAVGVPARLTNCPGPVMQLQES